MNSLTKYIVIVIENKEPLKIGAGGNKTNQTEPSKDYIPGSTIRGAIISQMVQKGIFKEEIQKAILSKMECYNAYPYREDRIYLPTPQHLRVDKHEWRKKKTAFHDNGDNLRSPIDLNDLLRKKDVNEYTNKDKNILEFRFIAEKNGLLVGYNVPKEYRLHHNTSINIEKEKKENLFKYQAIVAGQRFCSIIRFDETLVEPIQSVLKDTSTIYLGGAKGSGYGLCQIKVINEEILEDYQKVKQLLGLDRDLVDVKSSKTLTITCLSDCLIRNEYGQPINHIPVSYISEITGCNVELNKQFIQTGLTEGYNTTWQARYPKETVIKAGSVIQYTFETEQSEDNIKRIISTLECKLIGYRKQDGFGWIGININYPTELKLSIKKEVKAQPPESIEELFEDIRNDEQKKEVMSILSNGLQDAKERWLKMICIKSLVDIRDGDNIQEFTKPNFIISENLDRHHYRKMMNIVEKYLDKLIKNQLIQFDSSDANDRDYFNDNKLCSIANNNFIDILKYLSGKPNDKRSANLGDFAAIWLNSSKGRLFYFKENFSNNRYYEKLFIAELLHKGLYIQDRRKDK